MVCSDLSSPAFKGSFTESVAATSLMAALALSLSKSSILFAPEGIQMYIIFIYTSKRDLMVCASDKKKKYKRSVLLSGINTDAHRFN